MNQLVKMLLQAYVGESQARNRYTIYTKIAYKEEYIQISKIFDETAAHEKKHGKTFLEMANEVMEKIGEVEEMPIIDGVAVPTLMSNTIKNLKEAINGEHHESVELYPAIADEALKQGFDKMAIQIRGIAVAEAHHENRYSKLLEQLEKETIFKKDDEIWWYCQECGYWHKGKEPPTICPSCLHPKGHFKVLDENY